MTGRRFTQFFFVLAAALALLLANSHSLAADAARPGRQEHPMLDKIHQALDSLYLTADQKTQIEQIFAETREDIQAMAKDLKGMTPEQRREKIKPVIQGMIEKIKSVLTDDQKAQLKAKLAADRQERGGGAKKNAAGVGSSAPSSSAPQADVMPPATQPNVGANTGAAADAPVRGPLLQRVRDRLAKLDLSPQQQTTIDGILDDSARKFQALRQDAQNDAGATREKARDLMQSARQQIAAVLTPEQQQKWRETADPTASPPTTRKANEPKSSDTTPAKAAAASLSVSATQPTIQSEAASLTKSLYQGAAAPPFHISRLGGSAVTLDSFAGKPLVLIFGSFTCPTFRDKVGQIDQLAKQYRGRAAFLIVYTREAYPANEWDVQRNLTEQIKVDQHKSLSDRIKMAKLTQDGLKIATDMAVDDIDDAVTDAYDAMPNNAYVIAAGKIVVRQKWADPLGLPAWIDVAIKKAR